MKNKELTPLEVSKQLKDFVLEFVKNGLDRIFIHGSFDIIDKTLKDYEELTSKPVILYGRTHGHTQALVDSICKNYKEVKITNLEDEKNLKALEIIKNKNVDIDFFKYCCQEFNDEVCIEQYNIRHVECSNDGKPLTKEEYDLLKEALL